MNELGLGIVFDAKDLATGTMSQVSRGLLQVVGTSGEAGKAIKASFAEFTTGMALFGAGAIGLSMLQEPMRAATAFGKGIAEVSTLVDESIIPVQSMREMTMSLAATYGKLAPEEVKGLYEAISSGATTAAKATEMMDVANKLSIGGVTSVKTAIDGLTNVVNAYSADSVTAAEGFEAGWSNDTYLFELGPNDATAASFQGGGDAEAFERGWSNDAYQTSLGATTDASFHGAPVEDFEHVVGDKPFVAQASPLNLFLCADHHLGNGTPVQVKGPGLPSGAAPGITYYVANAAKDTFTLSTVPGGNPLVVLTSDGHGTVFGEPTIYWNTVE